MGKIKKRINEKNGKKAKIIISIVVIAIIVSCSIYIVKRNYDNTLKSIKNHYNQYVSIKRKTNLYNKNNQIIGNISKGFPLELDKVKIKDVSQKYYKIKDSDYYVYYKDTKKEKKQEKEQPNNNYIPFNLNIKTNKKIDLYNNNEKIITLNKGINIPIQYQDENNYYISFLNNNLRIKKNKNIKEVENQNTDAKEAEYISVLFYEKIEKKCNEYSCTPIENLKEQVNKLKENGYYTISTEDYKSYLNGFKRLKEKAIYLTTNSENEDLNSIKNELQVNIDKYNEQSGLKFNSTNKKSTKESNKESIDQYAIKSYTTIENLLKMANGEEVQEQEPIVIRNTSSGGGQGIAVLNYHFFYDSNLGESCNEGICLEVSKFREHLEYLKNNGYKTLTMEEFKKWMYGEMNLPEKSVLITVDDGAMGTGKHNGDKLIPLLEEFNMNATLFLIAGWWDISNYLSPNLTVQSHTFDMHQYGPCGRGQLNCATYEEAKADLQRSLEIIGNNDSFCFPFYMYSETSLKAVQDSGFKLAFIGGSRKATRNNNKFLIPRYPIHSDITLQQFINMVS